MDRITAIIPTFNEEVHIKSAIESVLWCDEIIVVDSFSTDKTVEIVKSFPQVRLLQHEYEHSAAQKNWTIPQATHPWIFLLDADERPTPELVEEVKSVVKTGTKFSAFWIYRRNNFMGKRINYSGWQSDKVIRLFKKDECRYQNKHVHAEIETKGGVSILREKLIHYTYKDLNSYLKKADRYTTWGAIDRFEKFQKQGEEYQNSDISKMAEAIRSLKNRQVKSLQKVELFSRNVQARKLLHLLDGNRINK